MIKGLSHITFAVKDLERSAVLLETVFGAEEVYSSGDNTFSVSKEKFFMMGGLWICLMEGGALAERTYNHVAFRVEEADLPLYMARIASAGAHIRPPRPRVAGEGQSVYFYDFDNHLFELHTGTLEERLERYAREP